MPTYRNDGKDTFSVVDVDGNTALVVPGMSVKTYAYLVAPMTRTADDPYFPIALKNVAVTVAGTASETDLISCKILRLFTTDTGISVKVDSANSTYSMLLFQDQVQDIVNKGEINSLHFTGTGTVYLVGLAE